MMGNEQNVAETLEEILKKHTRKVEPTDLDRLFFWAKDYGSTLDDTNIFDPGTRETFGHALWD